MTSHSIDERAPRPGFFAGGDDVPGLSLGRTFVCEGEEARLLALIDGQPWSTELSRRVQHYGHRYDYRARRVAAGSYLGPLPDWLAELAERLVGESGFERTPDQVIVNEYLPGQGIAQHTDCVPCFGGGVASLSLGSACVMDLDDPRSGAQRRIYLKRRSLLVLAGAARYRWRHGIARRKSDVIDGVRIPRGRRVSLTFRTVTREGTATV